jgi:hypothetical protein
MTRKKKSKVVLAVDDPLLKLSAIEKQAHANGISRKALAAKVLAEVDARTLHTAATKEREKAEEAYNAGLEKLDRIASDEDKLQDMPLLNQPPAVPEDDAWKVVALASLTSPGLSAGLLGKLAAVKVETLGALADFQQKHGDQWYREVKGIGKAALDKIADATEAFWRRRASSPLVTAPEASPPAEGQPGGQEAPPDQPALAGGLDETA